MQEARPTTYLIANAKIKSGFFHHTILQLGKGYILYEDNKILLKIQTYIFSCFAILENVPSPVTEKTKQNISKTFFRSGLSGVTSKPMSKKAGHIFENLSISQAPR